MIYFNKKFECANLEAQQVSEHLGKHFMDRTSLPTVRLFVYIEKYLNTNHNLLSQTLDIGMEIPRPIREIIVSIFI